MPASFNGGTGDQQSGIGEKKFFFNCTNVVLVSSSYVDKYVISKENQCVYKQTKTASEMHVAPRISQTATMDISESTAAFEHRSAVLIRDRRRLQSG